VAEVGKAGPDPTPGVRPGGRDYDRLAPDDERVRQRHELRARLAVQARPVRAGEALDMRP
jgi:hypothetical protein